MLDRATVQLASESGTGEYRFETDDRCFDGHFADEAIVPGVFIIEACGQLVAVVACAAAPAAAASIDLLASVERFKFLRPIVPGELMQMEANLGRIVDGLRQARVTARVGNQQAATGLMTVTVNHRRKRETRP